MDEGDWLDARQCVTMMHLVGCMDEGDWLDARQCVTMMHLVGSHICGKREKETYFAKKKT